MNWHPFFFLVVAAVFIGLFLTRRFFFWVTLLAVVMWWALKFEVFWWISLLFIVVSFLALIVTFLIRRGKGWYVGRFLASAAFLLALGVWVVDATGWVAPNWVKDRFGIDQNTSDCYEYERLNSATGECELVASATTTTTPGAVAPPTTVPPETQAPTTMTVARTTTTFATCESKGSWGVAPSPWYDHNWLPPNRGGVKALLGGVSNYGEDMSEVLGMLRMHPDRLTAFAWINHVSLGLPNQLINWRTLVDESGCLNEQGVSLFSRAEAYFEHHQLDWDPDCSVHHDRTAFTPEGQLVRSEGLGTAARYGCWVVFSVRNPNRDPQMQESLAVVGSFLVYDGSISVPDNGPNIPWGMFPEPPAREGHTPAPPTTLPPTTAATTAPGPIANTK
ncbi:MAG: TMEM181/wntless family protein [bacterium]|nr:TMEM181/wntless family protein [bacterium]